MADHPLIQAAQKAAEAHTAVTDGTGTHTDAVAAYEALGAVLATQFGELKAGVAGLEAFKLPRFLGFRREDGTFSGDGT